MSEITRQNISAGAKSFKGVHPAIVEEIKGKLQGKRKFQMVMVSPDHTFYLDEGENYTALIVNPDGSVDSASVNMPNGDTVHAGNVGAFGYLNKGFTYPSGTWLIRRGDYYVNYAVTVYHVTATVATLEV